jgi:hypothetical protein
MKITLKNFNLHFILICSIYSVLVMNFVYCQSKIEKTENTDNTFPKETEKIYKNFRNMKKKAKNNMFSGYYSEDDCKRKIFYLSANF